MHVKHPSEGVSATLATGVCLFWGLYLQSLCSARCRMKSADLDGVEIPLNEMQSTQSAHKQLLLRPVSPSRCGCYVDGFFGHSCERRHEMYCPNQCSGRGESWGVLPSPVQRQG